jgi:hypothetical protein
MNLNNKEIYKGYLVYVPITGWIVTLIAKVNDKEKSFLVRICKTSYQCELPPTLKGRGF